MTLFRSKITKKHIKFIKPYLNPRKQISNNMFLRKYGRPNKQLSLKLLFKISIVSRKLLKMYFLGFKNKKFGKLHKFLYKKDKKRLYFQNFFLTLERTTFSLLYQTKLVSKLKFLKKIANNRQLFVNGLLRTGYITFQKPLDFVHIAPALYINKKIQTVPLFSNSAKVIFRRVIKDNVLVKIYSAKLFLNKTKNRHMRQKKKKITSKCVYLFFFLEKNYFSKGCSLINRKAQSFFIAYLGVAATKLAKNSISNIGANKKIPKIVKELVNLVFFWWRDVKAKSNKYLLFYLVLKTL